MIDNYSRYLLACHLTASFSAQEVAAGLDQARAEAQRVCGPLASPPTLVTDNGVSFMATKFRKHLNALGIEHVRSSSPDSAATRPARTVSRRLVRGS